MDNLNCADIAIIVDLIIDASKKTDSIMCAEAYLELIGKVKSIADHAKVMCEAYNELNTIRARDGVPYMFDGTKSSVDGDYFSNLVDRLDAAVVQLTGKSAHLNPSLYGEL